MASWPSLTRAESFRVDDEKRSPGMIARKLVVHVILLRFGSGSRAKLPSLVGKNRFKVRLCGSSAGMYMFLIYP